MFNQSNARFIKGTSSFIILRLGSLLNKSVDNINRTKMGQTLIKFGVSTMRKEEEESMRKKRLIEEFRNTMSLNQPTKSKSNRAFNQDLKVKHVSYIIINF